MTKSIHVQLASCHAALKSFSRCMKDRRWHKLAERSDRIHQEMDALRAWMEHDPELGDDQLAQVKYLEIQLRRLQRQLSSHMQDISADVMTLERGINQADAARALLQQ